MNDIYKHKAEKYKYKYLKLKQELEGGFIYDGNKSCMYDLPIQKFDKNTEINNDEQLGQIEKKLNIIIDYKMPGMSGITSDELNKEGYIGQIFKYETYSQILQNLKILQNLNIDLNYINIVFACTIFKEKKTGKSGNNLIRTIFTDCDHILKKSSKEIILKTVKNKFGYIIYKNSDNECNKYNDKIQLNECNNYNDKLPIIATQKKKTIMISLKKIRNAIDKFIKPLHEASYVLNNIPKVTPDYDRFILPYNLDLLYVDIFKMTVMAVDKKNNDIKHLINLISHLLYRYFENDGDLAYESIQRNKDKITIDNLSNIITEIVKYLEVYEDFLKNPNNPNFPRPEWNYPGWK
jgi:hypothetical protein